MWIVFLTRIDMNFLIVWWDLRSFDIIEAYYHVYIHIKLNQTIYLICNRSIWLHTHFWLGLNKEGVSKNYRVAAAISEVKGALTLRLWWTEIHQVQDANVDLESDDVSSSTLRPE
jgi:hypothetical protein